MVINRYDQKRKIWIYLHRHRTEDDFERIHQHYQGVQKVKKNARKSPAKPKTPKAEKATKATKQQNQKAMALALSGNTTGTIANTMVAQQMVVASNEMQKDQSLSVEDIKEEIVVDTNSMQVIIILYYIFLA